MLKLQLCRSIMKQCLFCPLAPIVLMSEPTGTESFPIRNVLLRLAIIIVLTPCIVYVVWCTEIWVTILLTGIVLCIAWYEYSWLSFRIKNRLRELLLKNIPTHSNVDQIPTPLIDHDSHSITIAFEQLDEPLEEYVEPQSSPFALWLQMNSYKKLWMAVLYSLIVGIVVGLLVYCLWISTSVFHKLKEASHKVDENVFQAITYFSGLSSIATLFSYLTPCSADGWVLLVQVVCFNLVTYHSITCDLEDCMAQLDPLYTVSLTLVLSTIIRLYLNRSNPDKNSVVIIFATLLLDVLGLVYVTCLISVVANFTDHSPKGPGREIFLALLFVAWFGDIGAFLTGMILKAVKYKNYHRLAPSISPNKDIEGTVGGVLCSLVGIYVSSHTFGLGGQEFSHFIFAVAGYSIGRLGDLFESLLKRVAGVKDSSHIIPGHGGILDRIDSVLFIALVFTQFSPEMRFKHTWKFSDT